MNILFAFLATICTVMFCWQTWIKYLTLQRYKDSVSAYITVQATKNQILKRQNEVESSVPLHMHVDAFQKSFKEE